jgi:hypothetical protein
MPWFILPAFSKAACTHITLHKRSGMAAVPAQVLPIFLGLIHKSQGPRPPAEYTVSSQESDPRRRRLKSTRPAGLGWVGHAPRATFRVLLGNVGGGRDGEAAKLCAVVSQVKHVRSAAGPAHDSVVARSCFASARFVPKRILPFQKGH